MITLLIGFAVGFRGETGVAQTLAMLGMAACVGVATAALGAWVGLALRSAEGASATMLTVLFPITFASSVFVPVETMPGWLAAFAAANPVTIATDAARALALGGFTAGHALATFAWMAGIAAVFGALAARSYHRA